MGQQLAEQKIMSAFELQGIKDQLSGLLENSPKKIESFKTRIIKISLNPMLKNCSPESIINCGLQALTLNLPLEAGQGYIVNYGGTANFDCGYKGWQILAKRSGFSVLADVVYSCDEFRQEGFGFNREMIFIPNFDERKGSDDAWAKANLTGVIVSIREDETGNDTRAFVEAEMIHKIAGKSPSTQSDNARKYSPHCNWAEQMFAAKAIKQVLSKFAIDLEKSSHLHNAISIINSTESAAQSQPIQQQQNQYPQERFEENFPKWKKLVIEGENKAMAIITQLSNSYQLTTNQLEEVMTLKDFEPIEGETE